MVFYRLIPLSPLSTLTRLAVGLGLKELSYPFGIRPKKVGPPLPYRTQRIIYFFYFIKLIIKLQFDFVNIDYFFIKICVFSSFLWHN
ncbi:MAG: hypothetical protein PWQ37_1377 [Candidatus Petromonas sp.]|jgi:hypothetical protein|nr:hypothetical protein [Candidatus Petromonas sp.]